MDTGTTDFEDGEQQEVEERDNSLEDNVTEGPGTYTIRPKFEKK